MMSRYQIDRTILAAITFMSHYMQRRVAFWSLPLIGDKGKAAEALCCLMELEEAERAVRKDLQR